MADSSTTLNDATEQTQLLGSTNTTTSSYSTQYQRDDERSERVITLSLDNEPTVPLDELTDHIQHLLAFQQLQRTPSSQVIAIDKGHEAHDHMVKAPQRKHKKREFITDAVSFATNHWRENQSITKQNSQESTTTGSSSSGQHATIQQQQQVQEHHSPTPQAEPQFECVSSIWDTAKNASVCAVLSLIGERRHKKVSISADIYNDAILQRMALSTLEYGLEQTLAKGRTRQEMLFKPWIGDRSAIQWAVDNDFFIFLNDEQIQDAIKQRWLYGDPEWYANRQHPFQVWNTASCQDTVLTTTETGEKPLFTRQCFENYFARWAYPRYQCLVSLFTALVYLGFHLATLSNVEYMENYMHSFEYFYYTLVASDLVLQLCKITASPRLTLQKPSTYLCLSTAMLLSTSFIIRILAFSTIDLQRKYQELYFSFVLLSIATPLMFFRLFIWMDVLWWPIYKINYIIGQCIVQSLWVFFVALVSLIGFWVGLSALQRDDIGPWMMLRFLVLGGLHTPEIGGTVSYQPPAASILLVIYLFVMVILIGALLVASFLSTILSLTKPESSFGKLRKQMQVKRCSRPTCFGAFIPNMLVELVAGSIVWIAQKIYPGAKLTGLERLRQVIWFVIFSPVILVVGLVDLVLYLLYSQK